MKRSFLKNAFIASFLMLNTALIGISCENAPKEKKENSEVSDETLAYQEKFNNLMKENVAIHDEVMPKMTKLLGLIVTVEASDTMDKELQNDLLEKLKDAHSHMMSWMKNLSSEFSRDEVGGKIATVELENLKIKLAKLENSYQDAQEMSGKINESIEKAEAAVAELK